MTTRSWRAGLALCLWLALAVRLPMLSGERFHPDEALYATWARDIATGNDPWLAARVVDKPPLFIYLLALPLGTMGASEEAARLPNLLGGVACVLLVALLARRLYAERRVALLAAAAYALSPIAMLFSVTAFTDPLMLLWTLAALLAALHAHAGWCGFMYGLALATKQDAALFAPLVVLALWQSISSAGRMRASLRALSGFAFPALGVLLWTIARPQPDFLGASLQHYGPLAVVDPTRWLDRGGEWLSLAGTTGAWWLLVAALVVLPAAQARPRDRFVAGLAAIWIGLHVAVGFPVWDRYALPLAPLAAIGLARGGVLWYDRWRAPAMRAAVAMLWAVGLILPAGLALAGAIDAGRDFGRHAGIDAIGGYFWTHDTSATVLYVHDLSWEIDYYTYGRELDRRWFPDALALASDAGHMRQARRYLALDDSELRDAALGPALAASGLRLEPVLTTTNGPGRPVIHLLSILPAQP